MSRNLSNLYISESFQYLVQVSGSEFETGLGSAISSVNITASNAVLAATASYYGGTVTSASYAATATSASHALYADNAGFAVDVNALYTASVSDATIAFLKGGGGTFQITVDNVASASYALTASYAENAGVTVDTGSLLTTASFSGDQITFTKGDGSTFAGVITSVTSSISASYASTSTSASHAVNADTATNATSASLATNAKNAYVNVSAANVDYHVTFNTINAGYKELLQETEGAQFTYNPSNNKLTVENISATTLSGSLSGNATSATSASYALTASYADNVNYAESSSFVTIQSNNQDFNYNLLVNLPQDFAKPQAATNITVNPSASRITATTFAGNATTATSASYALTASYVAGIAAPGLVAGSGTDAMQSAAYLTAVPATASSEYSVALGYNARALTLFGGGTVAIGKNAQTQGRWSITIGEDAASTGNSGGNIAMGYSSTAANENSIAIGTLATSTDLSTAVGYNAKTGYASVAYGWGANNQSGYYATSLGPQSGVVGGTAGNYAVNVGAYSAVAAHETIAIGYNAKCNTNHSQSIMMGSYVTSSAAGEINLNNKWVYNGTDTTTIDGILAIDGIANVSASIAAAGGGGGAAFPYTGSAQITGSLIIDGPAYGTVNALSITSQTASLDCSTGNFFTLTLVDGTDTHLSASNLTAGQTINLQVTNGAVTGSGVINFSSNIKQVSGSGYVPTPGPSALDVVSMISFDGSSLLVNNVKNFV